MPKAPEFAPKPALEKLPLAVRKDIRDNFEAGKADLESQISELLGTPFNINVNPNEVWAYYKGSGTHAGSLLTGYVEGFISVLTHFINTYGDEGKVHFNEAVTQSELAIAVNPLGDKAETISAEVKDGVFVILFHHMQLGYNASGLGNCLLEAVEAVPRQGFSLVAKHSIDQEYLAEIDELTEEIGKILNMPDVILDPNFEENYAALAKAKKDNTSWQKRIGGVAFAYFSDGLRSRLNFQGFGEDEMMQEGFADVATSKTFRIRVVKATTNNATNETVLEDGVIYLQSTPEMWGYNASDMGIKLIDLL